MAINWNEDKMREAHEAILDAVIKKAAGLSDTEHIRRLAETVALLQGTATSPSSRQVPSSR